MKYQSMPRISTASISVMLALATIMVLALLLAGVIAAGASASCMTQREARAKFPTRHLFWHDIHAHCWDSQRGHRKYRGRPSIEPNGNIAPALRVRWYPRPFDGVELAALEPPVVLKVIDHRWPGANVADAAPVVIEPLTIVAELELNELDQEAR